MNTKILLAAGIAAFSLSAFAQTNSSTTVVVEPMAYTPTFRVVVVSRSVQAVNYRHRSGSTKLDFAGTDSDAAGRWRGRSQQQARFDRPSRPSSAIWISRQPLALSI